MVNVKSLRSCTAAILWPTLGLAMVLAVGVWGITQLANVDTPAKKAGYAVALAVMGLLAVGDAALLSALVVCRRRHRDLLSALLPREMLQSLTNTPANLLLDMMAQLLEGRAPSTQDVLFIRTALIANMDVYQPFNLRATIKGANLDADVAQSLMNQLGGGSMAGSSRSTTMVNGGGGAAAAKGGRARPSSCGDGTGSSAAALDGASEFTALPREVSAARLIGDSHPPCESLSSALALIMTPQPAAWVESGVLSEDLTSELARGYDMGTTHEVKPPPGMAPQLQPPGGVERRTPHGLAQHGQGLLEKAASLIDRGRRRRRASTEMPPVAAVVDVGREAGLRTSFVTVGPSHNRSSTVGNPATVQLDAGIQGLLSDVRPAGRRGGLSVIRPRSGFTDEQVPLPITSAVAAAVSGLDDESVTATTVDGAATADGGICTATAAPPAEPLLPRRLSAVWGMLSKRGTGNLGSSRMPSLDGGPSGRPSPNPSFSVVRASSTQNPLQQVGAELLQPLQSRLGVSRTASVRNVMGDAAANNVSIGASAAAASAAAAAAAALKRSLPPPPAVIDSVERLLSGADGWQFDTWALQEATSGHALSALGFYLIQRAGLIKAFRIKAVTLARLLRQLEAGYLDNPYHNAVHAADVLQTLHVIIHAAQLHVHYLDPLGLLAVYYAAIVHDFGHPGLTADFLVATGDVLAVRYNDRSPLENHHCAASFGLLKKTELDALAPLSQPERAAFRKMVIELVLATDMKQHFSILSHFNTVHRLGAYSQQQATTASTPSPNKQALRRQLMRRTFSRALSTVADNAPDNAALHFAAAWSEPAPKPADETERLLSLQVVLKCADIGHLGEALEVHKRWLGVLEEEFFRQGDRETQLGLPISPLFDRSKQGVSKSQVGFYDFVALPLVHALVSAFPGAQPLMSCFIGNYNHWRGVDGQPPVEVPATGKGAGSGNRRSWQQATGGSAGAAGGGGGGGGGGGVTAAVRLSEEQGGGDLRNMLLTVPDDAIETAAANDEKV